MTAADIETDHHATITLSRVVLWSESVESLRTHEFEMMHGSSKNQWFFNEHEGLNLTGVIRETEMGLPSSYDVSS